MSLQDLAVSIMPTIVASFRTRVLSKVIQSDVTLSFMQFFSSNGRQIINTLFEATRLSRRFLESKRLQPALPSYCGAFSLHKPPNRRI